MAKGQYKLMCSPSTAGRRRSKHPKIDCLIFRKGKKGVVSSESRVADNLQLTAHDFHGVKMTCKRKMVSKAPQRGKSSWLDCEVKKRKR